MAQLPPRENPFDRIDVREELDKLERSVEDLRLQFEQYFTGVIPLSPERLHNDVKRRFRKLLKAPFKSSEMSFKLRAIKGRYQTLHSYWQRVLRQREDGTYSKDVFKANLREKAALEDERSKTTQGATEHAMQNLFRVYKDAVERNVGKSQDVDYGAFQKAILQRTAEFKTRNQGKKVSFKVVIKDGKVTIKAQAKE